MTTPTAAETRAREYLTSLDMVWGWTEDGVKKKFNAAVKSLAALLTQPTPAGVTEELSFGDCPEDLASAIARVACNRIMVVVPPLRDLDALDNVHGIIQEVVAEHISRFPASPPLMGREHLETTIRHALHGDHMDEQDMSPAGNAQIRAVANAILSTAGNRVVERRKVDDRRVPIARTAPLCLPDVDGSVGGAKIRIGDGAASCELKAPTVRSLSTKGGKDGR